VSVHSAAEAVWPCSLPIDLAELVVLMDAACNSLSKECRPWRGSHSGDPATARSLYTSEARTHTAECLDDSEQLIEGNVQGSGSGQL
jgi:hypothetical protein